MADELNRSIEELWRDFEFLTKEISKFINAQDNDLVGDLMSQRDKLQVFIKEKNDQTYHKSADGKARIGAILAVNQDATNRLQQRYNQLKQQHKLSQAYDGSLDAMNPARYLDQDM